MLNQVQHNNMTHPPRTFTESHLVIATHNAGKAAEFAALFQGVHPGLTITSAAQENIPEPEETGTTFLENAILKARHAAQISGKPALADDSGLCVSALGGAPGIYSARYAMNPETHQRDFTYGMAKLIQEVGDNPDHSAHFTAALGLAWPDGHVESVEGHCHGTLVWPARGAHGHGYDPIFQPTEQDASPQKTFAEMPADFKNRISHRAVAFQMLLERCFSPAES
jgi:XTP/dITP diphosphohydrolase